MRALSEKELQANTYQDVRRAYSGVEESDPQWHDWLFRPVNPQTWDYDPRGWGPVVPTEPGLWWRTDRDEPVWVVAGEEGLEWYWDEAAARDKNGYPVTDEDDWIAPCVKPEVLP